MCCRARDCLGLDRGRLYRHWGWCGEQSGNQSGAVMADKQGRLLWVRHRGEGGGQREIRLLSQEGREERRKRLLSRHWRWSLVREKLLLAININIGYFPEHGTSNDSFGMTLHLSCVRRQFAGEGDLCWPWRDGPWRVGNNVFTDRITFYGLKKCKWRTGFGLFWLVLENWLRGSLRQRVG